MGSTEVFHYFFSAPLNEMQFHRRLIPGILSGFPVFFQVALTVSWHCEIKVSCHEKPGQCSVKPGTLYPESNAVTSLTIRPLRPPRLHRISVCRWYLTALKMP